jgi:hypothetical protein
MDYYTQQTVVAVTTASVIYALYRRYNRPSIRDIPGPPNPSWACGRLEDLLSPLFVLLIAILKDISGTGRASRPVLLKRASWKTMDPWLVGMARLGYVST